MLSLGARGRWGAKSIVKLLVEIGDFVLVLEGIATLVYTGVEPAFEGGCGVAWYANVSLNVRGLVEFRVLHLQRSWDLNWTLACF